MDRRHLIIPAALLAGSAMLGGRALLQTIGANEPRTEPAASTALATSSADDQQVADRAAQLDAMARRIDAVDSDVPPAVTPAPPQTLAVRSGGGGPGPSAQAGPSGQQPASAGSRHSGDDDAEEHEEDEDDDSDDGVDDDGPDHEADEHRGGDDDGGHGGDDD